MTIFDWLATPTGIELEHAVIVLLLSVASYFAYLSHRRASENTELLDGHIQQHIQLAEAAKTESTTSSGLTPPTVPPTI